MNTYWIYDIPNWLFFLLTIAFFAAISLGGLFLTRPLVRRILDASGKPNDITNYYFAAVGVLYGLTAGRIAVGTWQNFPSGLRRVSTRARLRRLLKK